MWVVTAYFVEPCKSNTSYTLRHEIDSPAVSKIAGCHRTSTCLLILCINKTFHEMHFAIQRRCFKYLPKIQPEIALTIGI